MSQILLHFVDFVKTTVQTSLYDLSVGLIIQYTDRLFPSLS